MKGDPSAPRDDVHYPSLPEPSAPPVAQPPVYHYSNPSQYVAPYQQPLIQLPPVAHVYEPPSYSGDYRDEGCCGMLFKLTLFHLMNAILGIAAFSIVISGISISVGLLPLCCFGIIFFRVVLYAVRFFAQLDVELYNYISSPEEHVYVSIPERAAFFGLEGRRLSPSLSAVSPLSLMATLYFLSIKFAMGIISLVVLVLAISFPLIEILAQTTDMDQEIYVNGIEVHDFNLDTNPVAFTVACVCVMLISVALMHVTARLSRAATRFFCCERFSTYRYVHAPPQYPTAMHFPTATTAYGTTSGY